MKKYRSKMTKKMDLFEQKLEEMNQLSLDIREASQKSIDQKSRHNILIL